MVLSRGNQPYRHEFDELGPGNDDAKFPELESLRIDASPRRPAPRRQHRPEQQFFSSPAEMVYAMSASIGAPKRSTGRSESPIEEQLLGAFKAHPHCIVEPGDFSVERVLALPGDLGFPAQMLVWQQHKFLDRFRADFAVASWRMNRTAIQLALVECDGKAFHTGGREQQRDLWRDRDAWDAGYGVFRFTGSQIYQDADACVSTVVSAFHYGSPRFPPLTPIVTHPLPSEDDPEVQKVMKRMGE